MSIEQGARRRPGRPRLSELRNTRERLLDEALKLFAAKGLTGTSLRDIAGAVGVRDSAIYAHFPSKQALFDTLMAEGGFLEVHRLGVDPAKLAERTPADALPMLVSKIMKAFDQPRARLFASVMMREGLFGAQAGSRTLAQSIAEVQSQLHAPFAHWVSAGLLREDFPVEHLVWELLAPLANARFVYLHSQASTAERKLGHSMAKRHVEFFLAATVRDQPS
jgi:AcrR family transcriptional regulator